ncbi:UNVERIFIED_CONTAM: hypothetical protein K2H54_014545 [Gekko kuhli]
MMHTKETLHAMKPYCETLAEQNLGIRQDSPLETEKLAIDYMWCVAIAASRPTLSCENSQSSCWALVPTEPCLQIKHVVEHDSSKTSLEKNALMIMESPAFRVILYHKLCLS